MAELQAESLDRQGQDMSTPSGYSRVQIVLHWVVVLLIAQQYLFKDAISNAWDCLTSAPMGQIRQIA